MNWGQVGEIVGAGAPVLGGLLGGPAGAAVGGLIASVLGVSNTPDDVSKAIASNPDAFVKLREIEANQKVKLQELQVSAEANRLAADTARLQSVNSTMQSETTSEHWPSYSWRPFCGFIVGIMAFGCYFVLPLLKIPVPAVPESVWLMFGAILGVASWFRGKAQANPDNDAPVKG